VMNKLNYVHLIQNLVILKKPIFGLFWNFMDFIDTVYEKFIEDLVGELNKLIRKIYKFLQKFPKLAIFSHFFRL
jgi:hypothetical protein